MGMGIGKWIIPLIINCKIIIPKLQFMCLIFFQVLKFKKV